MKMIKIFSYIVDLWNRVIKVSNKNEVEIFWYEVLGEKAKIFNGLYGGILDVSIDIEKKPERVMSEWCQRASVYWKEQADELYMLAEKSEHGMKKSAEMLLRAASQAGITYDQKKVVVLTEEQENAYIEWRGQELEEGDEIEVIMPAWYQKGHVLEQGRCKKIWKP